MSIEADPEGVETDRVFFHRTVEDTEDYTVRIESDGEEVVDEEGLTQDEAASILNLLDDMSDSGSRTALDYEDVSGETHSNYGTLKQVKAEYEFEDLDQRSLKPEGALGQIVRQLPESLSSVDRIYDSDLGDSAIVYIEGVREDLPGLIA